MNHNDQAFVGVARRVPVCVEAPLPSWAHNRALQAKLPHHPAPGFGERFKEPVTTQALIRELGQHIGKPLQLRVARPGDVVDTLTVVAVEASDPH